MPARFPANTVEEISVRISNDHSVVSRKGSVYVWSGSFFKFNCKINLIADYLGVVKFVKFIPAQDYERVIQTAFHDLRCSSRG